MNNKTTIVLFHCVATLLPMVGNLIPFEIAWLNKIKVYFVE